MMEIEVMKFEIPPALHANTPAERRCGRRDRVRLMKLDRFSGKVSHGSFHQIVDYLQAGDLLVLNNSRTIPAVLKGMQTRSGRTVKEQTEIRLARQLGEASWEALIVTDDIEEGDEFLFAEGLAAKAGRRASGTKLLPLTFTDSGEGLLSRIYKIGEPIRYEYIEENWELDYYQTVFSSVPGSVEMPSAGRAFTWELLFRLKSKGIRLAFIQLHTGLSYFMDDEWKPGPEDNPEPYWIPEESAELIKRTKEDGGRVIAVGTTVVRALETAWLNGRLEGLTSLYINSDHKLKAADGIITGFHEPEASHLDMLTAFICKEKLISGYKEAVKKGYLWHEFGDINLII